MEDIASIKRCVHLKFFTVFLDVWCEALKEITSNDSLIESPRSRVTSRCMCQYEDSIIKSKGMTIICVMIISKG